MINSRVNFLLQTPIGCWDINKTRQGITFICRTLYRLERPSICIDIGHWKTQYWTNWLWLKVHILIHTFRGLITKTSYHDCS